MRGLVVSAPASGSGKTTVTLGLIAALRARGMAVQPFKSGPDYIDPAFHHAAAGRDSFNLDSWAMGRDQIAHLLGAAEDADIALAEGSMGLFDGVATVGGLGNGASADIAALTGWPVLLVIDARGQAQSAAAVALGFREMRPDVALAGVVLNRVASARHEALMRLAFDALAIPVLGVLPREAGIELPERHLGLVQAQEHGALEAFLTAAGAAASRHLDLDGIVAAARGGIPRRPFAALPPPAERIALAQDDAFSFVYPHLIAGWRAAGATILPFSPLADQAPDDSAGACWLPGGYPELHLRALSRNGPMAEAIRAHHAAGKPILAECGGMLYLLDGLTDRGDERVEMLGLLPGEARMQQRLSALALQEVELPEGRLRGHTFHHSTLESPLQPLARGECPNYKRTAEAVYRSGRLTASYIHFYLPSDPLAAAALLRP